MILFSRNKKIQRDRNAGLVFSWRGGSSGNTGGLTLAIVIATSIFSLGMLGFKVYVGSATPPSRYRAEIIHVSKVDPSLRWLLERNSPHSNPWSSNQNEIGLIDVRDKMYAAIDGTRENKIQWSAVEFDEMALITPRIYEEGKVMMPSLDRHRLPSEDGTEKAEVVWYYALSAVDEKIHPRFPEQREYPIDPYLLKTYLGRTLKFSVNIDSKGSVVSCLPVEWNTDPEAMLVENWLNTVQFKPSEKEDQAIESVIIGVTVNGRRMAP